MYTTLEAIKDVLSDIPGVVTCKIGIEAGVSPDDYPIIRIVPAKGEHAATITRKRISVLIYFGSALSESDSGGLEAVYSALCTMESNIVAAMENAANPFTAVWQETITDEDRLEQYKLFVSRFDVVA